LFEPLRNRLLNAGFAAVGAVDLDLAEVEFNRHRARYQEWIQRGFQGDMAYLERGLARRMDPQQLLSSVQSVVAVLKPYDPRPVQKDGIRYARYLNQPDYHREIKEGLKEAFDEVLMSMPEFEYKVCVDTSAVLERTWAALCGLGWIGKNTLLIHPQLGSYTFIGVAMTNQKFGMAPQIMNDYCGHCKRCLEACPTQAFVEPHWLDSRKCISYLTLEKRGSWTEAVDTDGYLAGCDRCQEVCPFNTKPVRQADAQFGAHEIHPSLLLDSSLLDQETEQQYRSRIRDSALSRIKYADFKRNWTATQKSRS
jgi:epoxyqueuosine reductase